MARHNMINDVKVMYTQEEEDARDAEEAAHEAKKPALAFKHLRYLRNKLLKDSDYFALADMTMSDEMTAYRKLLRDLPGTLNNTSILSFDFDSGFPDKP